jgi:pyroglutamyl-peptidase
MSVLSADVNGHKPERMVIVRGGPAALRGRAPFADLLGALRTSGFPARLSRDAGRYLCNYVYWRALQRAGGAPPLVQFVHIPLVRRKPRRRRPGRQRLALPPLIAAAERLLIALKAASRR